MELKNQDYTSDDGKLNEYSSFIRLKVHDIMRPANFFLKLNIKYYLVQNLCEIKILKYIL